MSDGQQKKKKTQIEYAQELKERGWIDVPGFRSLAPDPATGETIWGIRLPTPIGVPGLLCRVTTHSTGKIAWKKLVEAVEVNDKYSETGWSVEWATDAEIPAGEAEAAQAKEDVNALADSLEAASAASLREAHQRLDNAAKSIGDDRKRITELEKKVARLEDEAAGRAFGQAADPDPKPF